MKYIVSALTKYVTNQKPQDSKKTTFRIDGFEDICIYDLFCKKIKEQCDKLGLTLIAKLSYPKYIEFKNISTYRLEFQSSILSMELNGWIDKDDSLTQFRNILSSEDERKIIILMGTEAVEDKGGLHDTFFINSSRLEADIHGIYSNIFNMQEWETEQKYCIDRLFKWLFDLVPVNLYKLSCLADDWYDIDNITMFIQYFYKTLPTWGLCKREENLPSMGYINKNFKKNLLSTNYDFIERNTFKKITKKQFARFNEKIEKYNCDNLLFSGQYEGWLNQSIKSYDEYALSLSEFILGENIKLLRESFLKVDFAITESVLELKLETNKNSKLTAQKIYGNPLSAMTGTLFNALIDIDNEIAESVATIDFNFIQAKLVNEINASEETTATEQLEANYKNICYATGGIMDYIAQRNWCLGEKEIDIISSPSNFFNPSNVFEQIENGRITALGISQSVNKIEFSIIFKDSEGNQLGKNKDYEWCIYNNESWLYSFTDICNKYKVIGEQFTNSFIPFGTNKDLKRIMHLKSEQEFFDVYESIDIEYEDLLTFAESRLSEKVVIWKAEYNALGNAFIKFCKAITTNGFYNSVDIINSLTDSYNNLGNKILQSSYAENLKWVLSLYIHAFAIEANNHAITRDEETDFCIIPPWHPATLQKLIHQAVFILDGCEQWWNKNMNNRSKLTQKMALANIAELEQLSCIHQAIDIFPASGKNYFGNLHTFGNFCLCGNINAQENIRIKDVLRKEAVFDDDFTESEFKQVDADSQMIFDILEDYVNAFPNKSNELSLAFIDPSELQPVVAAVHKYIEQKKSNAEIDVAISLTLNILVKPENRGGRNYLSYWVNTFFSQDENTDIKIYLNEWTSKDDIIKYLSINTDIVFMMDLLKVNNFGFSTNNEELPLCPRDCKYPMVFKPAPSSLTSINRRIELTQSQFESATIHSQVVYYNNHLNDPSKDVVVVKEVCIDTDRRELIDLLHKKAYWVICIDGGMDGALLNNNYNDSKKIYSIIGFSTGKGHHGQYNLTITARDAIVIQVNKRFKNRLKNLFKWTDDRSKRAADICVKEASKLDGVSLLSAINQNTYNINEFMAYILTSVQMQKEYSGEALNVVINLDSYRHWFSKDAYNIDSENKLRPDFLNISAKINDIGKLILKATVVECKIAKFNNSTERIEKALKQVDHGLNILSELFKPNPNESVRRRYWYAQLYRALAFSQITFHDNTEEYLKLAKGLKAILDGNFDIEWNGKIMGYWIDMQGDNIVTQILNGDNPIEVLSVPQIIIQKLILGDDEAPTDFVEVMPDIIEDMPVSENENNYDEIESSYDNNESLVIITDGLLQKPTSYEADKLSENEVSAIQNKQVENDIDTQPIELSDVKVFIGKDTRGNSVSWDFGHTALSNRHLLITGSSGQGKTYLMQTMIKELSQQEISSVVFDYTESFRLDQLETEFVTSLQDKINQKIVYFEGVPVNPFRRQEIEVLGIKSPEKIADVATRIADILSNVYKFQEQQFSAVYSACKNGIEKYGKSMNMQFFRKELENINSNPAKSVLSKLTPFFDTVIFNCDGEFDWNTITNSKGTLTIFQLTNFVRELQVVITEIMLWDAWHYNKKYGNKDKPFVVVLDEAQNLSHKANSPSAKILTEGRKFGWSAWFATQFLKPQLDDSEINRLQQSAFRVYFKPADNDLAITAKQLGPTINGTLNWSEQLRKLQKGQCIVAGECKKLNGGFGPNTPVVTKVASFRERGINK